MRLLLILIAVPIVEIALFIQVGGWIGTWLTIGIVILTAIIGAALIQSQGRAYVWNSVTNIRDPAMPVDRLAHGIFIAVAALLLITPGFFTDAVGLALLFPPVRIALITKLVSQLHSRYGNQPHYQGSPHTVEAEFRTVDGRSNEN